MERRKQAILLALPASLALLFLLILPMVYILIRTLTENGTADFTEFFTDPFYLDILWTTIRVSLVSTAVSLLLGYPTAYYMARTTSRLKQAMVIVILFPFLVSAVVRSYGWMVILGTNGLLNQLLLGLGLISEPLKLLNTEAAVIIGMIHLLIPYMILSLVGVLQSIDPNVEYAAYSLGASPMTTFRKGDKVTLLNPPPEVDEEEEEFDGLLEDQEPPEEQEEAIRVQVSVSLESGRG